MSRPEVRVSSPADLVVLDDDPMQVPEQDLAALPVWATMTAGEWTFRSDG